jgi:hypothetical protein
MSLSKIEMNYYSTMSLAEMFLIGISSQLFIILIVLSALVSELYVFQLTILSIMLLLSFRILLFYNRYKSQSRNEDIYIVSNLLNAIFLAILSLILWFLELKSLVLLTIIAFIVFLIKNPSITPFRNYATILIPTFLGICALFYYSYNPIEQWLSPFLAIIPLPAFLSLGIDFLRDYLASFALLFLIGIALEIVVGIIVFYQKKHNKPTLNFNDKMGSVWLYFLNDRDWKKWVLLIVLLLVASYYEELIYRFLLGNIGILLAEDLVVLPLIIIGVMVISILFILYTNRNDADPLLVVLQIVLAGIVIFSGYFLANGNLTLFIGICCSMIFGYAHFENGGWLYVINSFFAGLVFFFFFLQYGLLGSWALHFAWNFLVIAQMFANYIVEKQ